MLDERIFEKAGIWRSSLALKRADANSRQRERLRAGYQAFRRNIGVLVDQIQKDVPGLTLHDLNHLDALWISADVIAGHDYRLNPAEAFVFGGAILLHDAGLSIAAFPSGISDLKRTVEWRDSAVAILEKAQVPTITDKLINSPPKQYEAHIVFAVLRALHSRRAETLVDFEIHNTERDKRSRLLEDDTLRHHYGYVMGRIAASHNWPIEDLMTRLPKRVGAIGGLPHEWSVDPLKLACLLRCADAAQIDQRRAPDFLYALLRLRGISETHWRAQNKLSQALPDPDDPGALLFTSTEPYLEADSDAWWLAYDLVGIVDRELRSCDSFLRDTNRTPFRINRVKDADSPERLSAHIEAVGWAPVNADVHVTNVEHLAKLLGGVELYGYNPLIPLRELIQNAADAVRARRFVDIHSKNYRGRITVILRKEDAAGKSFVWLDVEDNGVGMSERVLTGPLLDFGTSLWRDSLVEQEFPGLRGARFQPTGQFGIGFYSAFMIADRIIVSSKRFDSGHQYGRQLMFRAGLSSRPLVIKQLPPDFGAELSTRVSIRLLGTTPSFILSKYSYGRPAPVTLAARLASLCPSLDCDIYGVEFEKGETSAHSKQWYDQDAEEWLYATTMPYGGITRQSRKLITEAARRLRLIKEGDKILGRAAISLTSRTGEFHDTFSMGHMTIGGLSADKPNVVSPRADQLFAGTIEARALQASRYGEGFSSSPEPVGTIAASRATLRKWGEDQLKLLSGLNLTPEQQDFCSTNFLRLGILVPQFIHAHLIRAGTSIRRKLELELVNVSKYLQDGGRGKITCAIRRKYLSSSRFFDMGQADLYRNIMEQYGVTEILLPTFDSFDWTKLPRIGGGGKVRSFANVLISELRNQGHAVKVDMIKVKTQKSDYLEVDGLLQLSTKTDATVPSSAARVR